MRLTFLGSSIMSSWSVLPFTPVLARFIDVFFCTRNFVAGPPALVVMPPWEEEEACCTPFKERGGGGGAGRSKPSRSLPFVPGPKSSGIDRLGRPPMSTGEASSGKGSAGCPASLRPRSVVGRGSCVALPPLLVVFGGRGKLGSCTGLVCQLREGGIWSCCCCCCCCWPSGSISMPCSSGMGMGKPPWSCPCSVKVLGLNVGWPRNAQVSL
mmetsp:Transcript_24875/g.67730  ORF Transcript_24875/g.67730 Transcript_24875/m.67730 type:complete len:211 (-) Transcript_24875:1611-2243(-)